MRKIAERPTELSACDTMTLACGHRQIQMSTGYKICMFIDPVGIIFPQQCRKGRNCCGKIHQNVGEVSDFKLERNLLFLGLKSSHNRYCGKAAVSELLFIGSLIGRKIDGISHINKGPIMLCQFHGTGIMCAWP